MTQIIRPSETDPFIASILNRLKHGRLTQAEARAILGCSRWTINRYCKRYGIDPKRARAAYLNRMMKLAAWLGRRYPDTWGS